MVRFHGGKARQGRHIVAAIAALEPTATCWVEPFIGGGNVAEQAALQLGDSSNLFRNGQSIDMLLADADPLVVAMWEFDGGVEFVPYPLVSEAEYHAARSAGIVDRQTALTAFGCSFGGKRWGGYARSLENPSRSFVKAAGNVWRRQFDHIHSVNTVVILSDYADLTVPDGAIVYCDPPYSGTTGYRGHGWDPERFYRWAEALSVRCSVYVSEYAAPSHWVQVWERDHQTSLKRDNKFGKVTERLFQVRQDLRRPVRARTIARRAENDQGGVAGYE
jgi:DNA adenine methylase